MTRERARDDASGSPSAPLANSPTRSGLSTVGRQACLQAAALWSEVAMLDRLLYKNIHQHRGAHFLRYLKEVSG